MKVQFTEQDDFQAQILLKLSLFSTETDSVYYAGFSASSMNPRLVKCVLDVCVRCVWVSE